MNKEEISLIQKKTRQAFGSVKNTWSYRTIEKAVWNKLALRIKKYGRQKIEKIIDQTIREI